MKQLLTRLSVAVLVLAVLAATVFLLVQPAEATPSNGLQSVQIATGELPEPVGAKFKGHEGGFGDGTDVAKISVVKFTLEPGGTFGWHQHSGPVWAVVTSGTLTIYDGDDATCTPHVYAEGEALLDPGSDTHLGVNETNEPVEIYATFMLPEGGLPRIDADDPGFCQ